jgi:hypothetical protein
MRSCTPTDVCRFVRLSSAIISVSGNARHTPHLPIDVSVDGLSSHWGIVGGEEAETILDIFQVLVLIIIYHAFYREGSEEPVEGKSRTGFHLRIGETNSSRTNLS